VGAEKAAAPKRATIFPLTEFHRNFQEASTWLPLLMENPERKYRYSPLAVLIPARDAIQNVVPALRTIECMVSIPKPTETVDLGTAEELIAQEEYFDT
jgi:hypothetical protein